MKYFGIIDKNVAAIFQLHWKIGNISDMFLQYSVLCGEGSTLINFGLPIKEDFWYVLFIFLDFTGLNVCNIRVLSFVYKVSAQSEKSRKVDAITSILRKIQNPIKFETLLRFRPNFKIKPLSFYLQFWKTIRLKTCISRNSERKYPFSKFKIS